MPTVEHDENLDPGFRDLVNNLVIEVSRGHSGMVRPFEHRQFEADVRAILIEGLTRALVDDGYCKLLLRHLDSLKTPANFTSAPAWSDERIAKAVEEGLSALFDDELAELAVNPFQLLFLRDNLDETDLPTEWWLDAICQYTPPAPLADPSAVASTEVDRKVAEAAGVASVAASHWLRALYDDVAAAAVVYLIALPTCLAVAVASGVPPIVGLVSGAIGGIVVGAIGGCPLSVSGPAVGLVTVNLAFLRPYHERGELANGLALLGLAVLIAGVLQIVAGLLRLGSWIRVVPAAVVHGMLAGTGIVVFLSQWQVMIGMDPTGYGLTDLLQLYRSALQLIGVSDTPMNRWPAAIGLLTIAVALFWQRLPRKVTRLLPARLIAVIIGSAAAGALGLAIDRISLDGPIEPIGTPDIVGLFAGINGSIVEVAILIAVLVSVESLLCCVVVDYLHAGRRANLDRVLVGQGVGNVVCGFLGGLPLVASGFRSATNVWAGARTRLSTIALGVGLLITVLCRPQVLQMIPVASLAAVMVLVGFQLMSFNAVRSLFRCNKSDAIVYAVTILAIVTTDLLLGVMIGTALQLCHWAYQFWLTARKGPRRISQGGQHRSRWSRDAENLPLEAPETESMRQHYMVS